MSDLPTSSLANTLQALSRALSVLGPDAPLELGLRHDPRLDELISTLPKLTEEDLGSQSDGVCPICLVQFRAHLAEEETALAMDSPAHAEQDLGVTRLDKTCRHIFCRKDISMWIRQSRNSCPTCRCPLLEPLPEATESSQDGSSNPTDSRDLDSAAQMADEVVREVLAALGPADDQPSADQADAVRRLVETLLPGAGEFHIPPVDEEAEREYPERSEFGMYS